MEEEEIYNGSLTQKSGFFQISDDQRAEELEGLYPGLARTVSVNDLRQMWGDHVLNLFRFIGVSEKMVSEHDWNSPPNLDSLAESIHTRCFKKLV
jgi:hypothetical protein